MMANTDWENVEKWYGALVGKEGHYYHQHVILPNLLPLLSIDGCSKVLDLGCGQGVLARSLPKEAGYHGFDLSASLLQQAGKGKQRSHRFTKADICKPLPIKESDFTHALIILALQNVAAPDKALKNAAKHLQPGGILAIVLNHPCFRIPRQSHWGIDHEKKLQYRRIDLYLTPLKIPIQTHPSQKQKSEATWSFHRPISAYSRYLAEAGFAILQIEEWTSDKKSTGKAARMENRARAEFPLFLTFICQKVDS
ncbi:MAG: class I SAM-dependent methyltransferase [Chlamydiales bacterium]|nr:class I SAM-dependent methyltransferase [Chlamydiales bacterium]